ncbi:hypothetical protein DMUE_6121, partial [Dictyocoela muelleri]
DRDEILIKKKKDIYNEILEVNIIIEGTDLNIKEKIKFIDNIKEIDIEEWFNNFLTISVKKNWTWFQSCQMIGHLIRDKNFDKNLINESIEKTRDQIIKNNKNNNDSLDILIKIDKLKQNKFYKIKNYFNEIEKEVFEYGRIEKIGKLKVNRRVRESFLKGLSLYTDMELCKHNLVDIEDILTYIDRLENKIISKCLTQGYNHESNIKKENYIEKIKWCKIHKSNYSRVRLLRALFTKKVVKVESIVKIEYNKKRYKTPQKHKY